MSEKIHIPIIDPLGILGRPAAKLIKNLTGADVVLRDPVRDFVIDVFTEDDDEVGVGEGESSIIEPVIVPLVIAQLAAEQA